MNIKEHPSEGTAGDRKKLKFRFILVAVAVTEHTFVFSLPSGVKSVSRRGVL